VLRDSYLFGATSDASLAKEAGVEQPAIVLYKTFDEGKNTYEEKFDVEAIKKFAKTAATPLIGEVGPETYSGYMEVSSTAYAILKPEKLTTIIGWSTTCIHLR
jgi:protein disulfide-isomerase A1